MRSIVAVILVVSTSAYGGHTLSILNYLMGPSLIGVVGGRPATDTDYAKTVRINRKLRDGGNKICSGVIVEGCILTASHCIGDNQPHDIMVGASPTQALTYVPEFTRWGDGTTPQTDLAIIKPNLPPPAASGYSRDAIAKEPPKKGDSLDISGYGIPGTTVENKVRKNLPPGEKHWGGSEVLGFGEDETTVGDTPASLIVTGKDSALITPGDSGGPLEKGGIIYGIATEVKQKIKKRNDQEQITEQDLTVDNITRGYHVNIAKKEAREWIIKTLAAMGCRGETKEGVELQLRDLVRDNMKRDMIRERWKAGEPKQEIVDLMKEKMRRLLGLPKDKPMGIEPVEFSDQTYKFFYNVGPIEKPESTGKMTVEIDTGKVVLERDGNAADVAPALPPGFRVPEPPPEKRSRKDLTEPIYREPLKPPAPPKGGTVRETIYPPFDLGGRPPPK